MDFSYKKIILTICFMMNVVYGSLPRQLYRLATTTFSGASTRLLHSSAAVSIHASSLQSVQNPFLNRFKNWFGFSKKQPEKNSIEIISDYFRAIEARDTEFKKATDVFDQARLLDLMKRDMNAMQYHLSLLNNRPKNDNQEELGQFNEKNTRFSEKLQTEEKQLKKQDPLIMEKISISDNVAHILQLIDRNSDDRKQSLIMSQISQISSEIEEFQLLRDICETMINGNRNFSTVQAFYIEKDKENMKDFRTRFLENEKYAELSKTKAIDYIMTVAVDKSLLDKDRLTSLEESKKILINLIELNTFRKSLWEKIYAQRYSKE